MITEDDIVRYLVQYGAAQSIEAVRPAMPRWIRQLRQLGVDSVPLTLGSASARHIDRFWMQASKEPSAQLAAHDMRDTMPEVRPYKGR
jgi:hypothetical protein